MSADLAAGGPGPVEEHAAPRPSGDACRVVLDRHGQRLHAGARTRRGAAAEPGSWRGPRGRGSARAARRRQAPRPARARRCRGPRAAAGRRPRRPARRRRGSRQLADTERPRDRGEHQPGLAHGRELHHSDRAGEVGVQDPRDVDGEGRLAHPARARERQQPGRAGPQEPDHLAAVVVSADERCRREREPGRPRGRSSAARCSPATAPRCSPARCGVAPRAAARQGGAVVLVEGERVGERPDGVRVRAAPLTPLEGADRLGGQPGARGQLLLAERGSGPDPSQHLGERAGACRSPRPPAAR